MPVALYLVPFVFGLLIGSFLNVCIYRIPQGRTIVRGRSYCPACHALIPWYFNLPLVSYLFLRGRCKSCHASISPIYPIIEAANALLWALAFLLHGFTPVALLISLFFSILLTISCIDWVHQIIPNGLVIALLLLGIMHAIYHVIAGDAPWYDYGIGFFAASLPLLILGLIFPSGMGGGDIKFMAAAGLFLGWKWVLFALFAGNIAALFYVGIRLLTKQSVKNTRIPFGPFLSIGIFLAIVWGEPILAWYLSLF